MSIPKTIHYCWFGRNPLPELAVKCIASWKKYCPDYEIIEWNEDNFDLASAPLYVRQAYEAKKWAFVSDYVRLYAMTGHGGVYMDTDVELLAPLDRFLAHSAFSGFEDNSHISTGIMACEKSFPLFLDFLHYYDTASFILPDGSLNTTTNVSTITDICAKHGFIPNDQLQTVDSFTIYPHDVFCPIDYDTGALKKTKNTVAIHWFSGSWQDPEQLKAHKKIQALSRITGRRAAETIFGIFSCIKREGLFHYVKSRGLKYAGKNRQI